jgi:lipoate-protein ligase A
VTGVGASDDLSTRRGSVGELLGAWPSDDRLSVPAVARCRPVGPTTVVLGSAQRSAVEPGASGPAARAAFGGTIAVTVRRGGGGAVLVRPGGQVWLDLWLPRGHRLWDEDPAVTAVRVGRAWAAGLTDVGGQELRVHEGRLGLLDGDDSGRGDRGWDTAPLDALGRAVCFAAVGPGEVVTGAHRRKVVGISQLRTRAGARVLTMAPLTTDPGPLVATLLQLGLLHGDAADLGATAASRAIGLAELALVDAHDGGAVERVEQAVVGHLLARGDIAAASPG